MRNLFFKTPSLLSGTSFFRGNIMNAVKYALAVAVMALSATVSAQVVFVPDFPVKKPAETQTATADAPAAAPHQEA